MKIYQSNFPLPATARSTLARSFKMYAAVRRKKTPPSTSTKDVEKREYWRALNCTSVVSSCCAIGVAIVVAFSAVCDRIINSLPKVEEYEATLRTFLIASEITPTRYGEPASPNACDMRIWKASAVDLLVGTTTYCTLWMCVGEEKEKFNNINGMHQEQRKGSTPASKDGADPQVLRIKIVSYDFNFFLCHALWI